MTLPTTYYSPNDAMWPDLANGKVALAPVRVGMDRRTGKMLVGWPHVEQSISVIFATRFHERVLRRWVGSFVPHILGQSAIPRVVTRFFWAIASAIDLWEPNYSIKRITLPASVNSAEQVRRGTMGFRNEGVYRPRGHLGDSTAETRRSVGFVGRGNDVWDAVT